MAQASAKGGLSLTIEENELEARFEFTPDPNGAEWTADKLQKLAQDARLPTVTAKRAEDIISRFSRSKAKLAEVVASGTAPENPRPEQAEWAALDVPGELRDIVAEIAASAGEPELWRTTVQNVRTEKKVTKPGALPFLPSKVETLVVTEKVESRERVRPSDGPSRTGYARKGERIAILSTAKPGKAGKSIFGMPLPYSGEAGAFVLGRGVLRNKNELLAEIDGVVRAGESWVEVLPLEAHRFALGRSANGTTLILDYWPGHPRLPRTGAAAVRAEATKLGAAAEDLVSDGEIDAAIADASASGKPLLSFPLSPDRDAVARVDIAPDALRATLTLLKGRGRGKALELSRVTEALKASGLRGLPVEEIKKAVLAFHKGPEQELRDYLLVEGRAPTRGKDRVLALSVTPLAEERAADLRARLAEHPELETAIPSLAAFPLSSLSSLAFVVEGQKLGELSPPGPGREGLDINGAVLPGLPGNDPAIQCLEGVSLGKGSLAATRAGLLMAEKVGGTWFFRVVAFRDATVEAQVSGDGMEGHLSLRAEEGLGRPLDMEAVIKAIADRGIVFGGDPRAIAEAVADARAGKPVLRRVIARGRAPRPAGTAKVEWSLPGGRPEAPVRVALDQELLRAWKVGGEGERGCDVLGKELPVPLGSVVVGLPSHDKTIIEKEVGDGCLSYRATVAGDLRVAGDFLAVSDRVSLERDLVAAEGELRFGGAVEVGGSILRGAKLFAAGDISVRGSIAAAVVSSEGSVAVSGGVKGEKRGTIRAMRGLELLYAEQALLLAVEDIVIRGACMLCNVKTNGKLSLGGAKGILVGGLVRARKGVDAEVLGAENGTRTEVAFGQDYLVADMIENEEREIEKVKTAILQADRTMAELERAGAGLDRVRQDKVKLLKLLEKRSARLFDFREKFEQHFPGEVRVRGAVFPGVILESHNRVFEVRSRKSGVIFGFDQYNGRIVERPLT